ncbi:GntR family transcriptional regulator [Couchioplanes caeruleus]|nr:GntR family transcriptional regulator [Couchioplanes caeruleus]
MHSRYRDIAARIQQRIEAGEWKPGARLPRLDDLATEYGANRDTVGRAIALLETEGFVWAVQGRGISVRYGTMRPRRPRGNLVKRNAQALGYSFPSASGAEKWVRHGEAVSAPAPLDDPRLARLLGVAPETEVLRRVRVTGPASEAPFQIAVSWIAPRVAGAVTGVSAEPAAGDWLYRIERAGHWPISWTEFHRARMPSLEEADLLQIPVSLPVLEIVRQGLSGTDGKPVEVTEYVIASDRVETVHVLQRAGDAVESWPEREGDAS